MRRSMLRQLAVFTAMMSLGAPSWGASAVVVVSASVSKPILLTWVQDLNLGSIAPGPGSWSGATVSISRTGVFSCSNPNLTCTGVVQTATYNVQGSNNTSPQITAPNVVLTNQNNPSQTLTLVVDNPGSVTLTNSGFPGSNFNLGGSVTISSATEPGVYAGTFNVTVDY